VHSNTN